MNQEVKIVVTQREGACLEDRLDILENHVAALSARADEQDALLQLLVCALRDATSELAKI
jgi:hypothetical protein